MLIYIKGGIVLLRFLIHKNRPEVTKCLLFFDLTWFFSVCESCPYSDSSVAGRRTSIQFCYGFTAVAILAKVIGRDSNLVTQFFSTGVNVVAPLFILGDMMATGNSKENFSFTFFFNGVIIYTKFESAPYEIFSFVVFYSVQLL